MYQKKNSLQAAIYEKETFVVVNKQQIAATIAPNIKAVPIVLKESCDFFLRWKVWFWKRLVAYCIQKNAAQVINIVVWRHV